MKYIVCDLDFETYIGIVLSFLDCLIGVFVLEQIRPNDAVTLNEFLDLANDLLHDAKPNDKLLFVLPTFYIGGRLKEHEHRAFIRQLPMKVDAGVTMEIYTLSHNRNIDDQYLSLGEDNKRKYKMLYSDDFDKDPLVEFNKNIYHIPSKKTQRIEDYFDDFFKLSKFLNEHNILKNLNKNYEDNRIIGIVNETQHKAILGTYSNDGGILPTGQLIDNKETVRAIRALLLKLINEYKEE